MFNLSIFSITAYSFNSASICGHLVLERETKIKYCLNAMGCRSIPYWLGTFICDYILFLFGLGLFMSF